MVTSEDTDGESTDVAFVESSESVKSEIEDDDSVDTSETKLDSLSMSTPPGPKGIDASETSESRLTIHELSEKLESAEEEIAVLRRKIQQLEAQK